MTRRLLLILLVILVAIAPITSLLPGAKADITFPPNPNCHVPMINFFDIWDGTRSSPLYPYVAGYMFTLTSSESSYWTTQKVEITACFPNTPDPSVIGSNNWLAAGMFLEGQDSATDHQDYGFYDVIVIDNTGNRYLDVGVWMDNEYPTSLARTLLFSKSWLIQGSQNAVTLKMYWDPGSTKTIFWTIIISGQEYNPPGNSFDIGAARPNDNPIKGFYVGMAKMTFPPFLFMWWACFFQFGIISPHAITQGGWEADLLYPQYANTSSSPWQNVATALSVEGPNAYLDYNWLWGEQEFSGVDISSGPNAMAFHYDGNTIGDDVPLWWPGSGGGRGCPYVYTWSGQSYIKDNNILPASETGNGTDAKDYYKLQQPLVPVLQDQQISLYSLQIREFEQEHDYIDQVKLIAVDHSQSTSVAVTPEGEIITYQNPVSPASCVDNEGNDRLSEIGRLDGRVSDPTTHFQGYEGDWLLLNFGRVTATNAKLIVRDDQKCTNDLCINVQVPDMNGGWQTVEVLHPRDFWAVEAVNLTAYIPTNGDFIVRLLWTATHRLDYVGLDMSSPAQTTVSRVPPILAVHSTMGDVNAKLLYDDENSVELIKGQHMTLAFTLPNKVQGTTRDFILYTDGYYYT